MFKYLRVLRRFKTPFLRNSIFNYDIKKLNYSCDKGLSNCEKEALFKTICVIDKNPECFSMEFFKALFKEYPSYAKHFKKYGSCPEAILANKSFKKKHAAGKFMPAVLEFVRKIDDPCEAEMGLKKIHKVHKKHCVKPEQFKDARKIFLKSLEYNLGDKWNSVVAEGWKKVTTLLFKALAKGVKRD
ncbi:uncharacterized protein LOC142330116 isoform X2 [Lycorma delicatula]|uniref:uncharacterized protein LOC142330116 isoform X2 n=1 Tax=Lycorma delicatula TaxID=130591 RepID=UPI003F5183C1